MKSFDELIDIVRKLRSPEGCPWDREQTARSLIPYFLEETHEAIDAIEHEDNKALKKELGDVMLHLVFQTLIAEEAGAFGFDDVLEGISEKMRRRHPHVFQKNGEYGSEDAGRIWEQEKSRETREHRLDGIPQRLPELHRAFRMQQKAAALGFDWEETGQVWEKLDEEISEFHEAAEKQNKEKMEDEMGDLFFVLVNLSRFYGLHPGRALKRSNDKFYRRFSAIEDYYKLNGKSMKDATPQELDAVWEEIKRSEF